MSLHKLTAGSGYDYLTRQVAAHDSTEKGHTGLASYYTEKGETPGVWVGSGMAGIDGLEAGDIATADHMQSLFGSGHHPLATDRTAELNKRIGREGVAAPTAEEYKSASRLGTPYKVYSGDVSPFRLEVAKQMAAFNEAAGLRGDWPVPARERARIRTEVARSIFTAEHGREPADAREIATTIAKHSRTKTTAVAGFDLTFSPVKSVSVLWALADPSTAAAVEKAHQAAIADALRFIETRALFTREGANGARQVDVRGLVATAFTHRDSRAGDPDLHTHVAVANKVQTADRGTWLAVDGRNLYKAAVAASETYNTALERHLGDTLGVRFAARPNPDARKRPIREIVGIDPKVNEQFSKRRQSVEVRRKELAAAFQATHGRPPTPVETLNLAQQATLETREAKHEPRSLGEQRAAWHGEALNVLGSRQQVARMIHEALSPQSDRAQTAVNSAWFTATADQIIATMEGSRATWQYWHVYAEAQRQIRAEQVPTEQVDRLAELLVDEVLTGRSLSLARPSDGVVEPEQLRRSDGASVYTVAGADLFTSAAVLDAERRLVDAAGRHDGYAVDTAHVDMALLESTANGLTLNAGQSMLVREMATSGSRLQLAIAPAGSGKTTAMKALTAAWSDGGGTLIGLAPSAAAAAALRTQTDAHTDTLAKLTHSLSTGELPRWAAGIDSSTLVVIDEAGMADTLALDTAVEFILARGASVRLIGDDQQLSAIGAGGVLRDIRGTHGALQLSELVRFADPAEGAASLSLREGNPEALGFYLDRDRVHVGDLASMTEDVFGAWQADRSTGLDSVMLAPTRDLVGQLNHQARAHRLEGLNPDDSAASGLVRRLSDGNEASVGELVITRSNDRRLRTSATDWVKNGDRWTVLDVHEDGGLSVQHLQHGRIVRLPSEYVSASTELGYACTVHTAQGVTADTMHGLLTGSESRQQLYTMMTRGALANHVYLEVVGDGDPHSVIHPSLVRPLTSTEILESILARDDAQQSATSLLRDQRDPAGRLGDAAQRYIDSLYFAAEDIAGEQAIQALEEAAEQAVPGLTDEPAWPALSAHLLLLAADGDDPIVALRAAVVERELATAEDRAAVLDWRLDASGMRNAVAGPLPWMPAVPAQLGQHELWGPCLAQRSALVAELADQVQDESIAEVKAGTLPRWTDASVRPDAATVVDVEVWRAATRVDSTDRRPVGPPQLQKALATWQERLARRVAGDHAPALAEWRHLLSAIAPQTRGDDFTPVLAERLAAMSRSGVPAHQLLRGAVAAGDLPVEHAAAALWWRMSRHLSPAVAAHLSEGAGHDTVTAGWVDQLSEILGATRTERITSSPWWPSLVANVDQGLQRGWQLPNLLPATVAASGDDGVDECLSLVWHTSIALTPPPVEGEDHDPAQDPPDDLWEGFEPHESAFVEHDWNLRDHALPADDVEQHVEPAEATLDPTVVDHDLLLAELRRPVGATSLPPTDADLRAAYERDIEWDNSPIPRERMVEINNLAQDFFETHLPGSWGQSHLADRFGVDLTGHPQFRPGQAPAGWTNLVNHLRRSGVGEEEMLAAGLATRARTGRLIDRFRDRVIVPVQHRGDILGFVGRRHPQLGEGDGAGPKYLNTGATPLFHKGDQLFVADATLIDQGATPVLVEGPMDALAVTIASSGRHVGVTPLGTSLTHPQAAQLAAIGRDPIVATDPDIAGQVAAERDYWLLTPHGLDPTYAQSPAGLDPADILVQRGPQALVDILDNAYPLGEALIEERLAHLDPAAAFAAAVPVIAARPSAAWNEGVDRLGKQFPLGKNITREALRDATQSWEKDPRRAASNQLAQTGNVRNRLEAAATQTPATRWSGLANDLDSRLVDEHDWPATAAMLQEAHDAGHNVASITHAMIADTPLDLSPATDLRYRLAAGLDLGRHIDEATTSLDQEQPVPGSKGAQAARQYPRSQPMDRQPGHRR